MIRRLLTTVIIFSVMLVGIPSSFAQATQPEIALHHSWGGEGNVINSGSDLAVTAEGHLLIVNGHYNRITRIMPGEETFQNFGGLGFGEEQMVNASGLTIGPDGSIYLAAYGRIQIFSSQGEYLRSIWSFHENTDIWDFLRDVAIDEDGNLHVIANYGDTNLIKSFSQDGTPLGVWNTPTGSDIPLINPMSIEVTPDNNLIIAEFGDSVERFGRVVVCDTQGNFIKDVSQFGESDHFERPVDIATNPVDGSVFVVDAQKWRVYKFSPDLTELLDQWGEFGQEPGQLYAPISIEFDSQGNLVVLSNTYHIQVFTPEGEYLRSYGIRADSPGQFKTPFDILISSSGVVYVADSNNGRIQAFDLNGTFLYAWNIDIGFARGLADDSSGNIYVTQSDKLCKYNAPGELLECWGQAGLEPGQFDNLQDVAVKTVALPSGTEELVFTVDNSNRLQIFGTDGTFVRLFTFDKLVIRLAVDNSGIIFALTNQADVVYKFNTEGEKLAEGTLPGLSSSAMELGPDGYIYLADQQINRIHRMNPQTMLVEKTWWGDYGDVNTYFHGPTGFSFSDAGLLYLIDGGNARVLVFELVDNEEVPVSHLQTSPIIGLNTGLNLIQNGDFESELNSSPWTFCGPLPHQRSNVAYHGNFSLQLGQLPFVGQGYAQAYTTLTIPNNFAFPVLNFHYQIQASDLREKADLYVEIQDGVGLNHLIKVAHAGIETVQGPALWQEAKLSLDNFVGQTIRISFVARNREASSTGVLALIDDVKVISSLNALFLPLINR